MRHASSPRGVLRKGHNRMWIEDAGIGFPPSADQRLAQYVRARLVADGLDYDDAAVDAWALDEALDQIDRVDAFVAVIAEGPQPERES